MNFVDGIPIWGTPDEGAVSQIKTCARTADKVALMADHHKGLCRAHWWSRSLPEFNQSKAVWAS